MIETRIELPDAPTELRKQVEAADAVLRNEANKIKGLTLSGIWRQDDPTRSHGHVHLALRLGQDGAGFGLVPAELQDLGRVRSLVREALWTLTTEYAQTLQQEILQLREELKGDLEPLGA